jgi:hypothetical protein
VKGRSLAVAIAASVLLAACGSPPAPPPATPTADPALVDTTDRLATFVTTDWTTAGASVARLRTACVAGGVPACYRQSRQSAADIAVVLQVVEAMHIGPHLSEPVGSAQRGLAGMRSSLNAYQEYLLGHALAPSADTPAQPSSAPDQPPRSRAPQAGVDDMPAFGAAVNAAAAQLNLDPWDVAVLPRLTPDPRAADPAAKATPTAVTTTPVPSNCDPKPCMHDARAHASVRVTGVHRSISGQSIMPYPDTHFIRVVFIVAVDADAPASVLVGSSAITVTDIFGGANRVLAVDAPLCGRLDDRQVPPGETDIARSVCFQVGGPVDGHLALNWKPGIAGVEIDIALP